MDLSTWKQHVQGDVGAAEVGAPAASSREWLQQCWEALLARTVASLQARQLNAKCRDVRRLAHLLFNCKFRLSLRHNSCTHLRRKNALTTCKAKPGGRFVGRLPGLSQRTDATKTEVNLVRCMCLPFPTQIVNLTHCTELPQLEQSASFMHGGSSRNALLLLLPRRPGFDVQLLQTHSFSSQRTTRPRMSFSTRSHCWPPWPAWSCGRTLASTCWTSCRAVVRTTCRPNVSEMCD